MYQKVHKKIIVEFRKYIFSKRLTREKYLEIIYFTLSNSIRLRFTSEAIWEIKGNWIEQSAGYEIKIKLRIDEIKKGKKTPN